MPICKRCGTAFRDSEKICPACGDQRVRPSVLADIADEFESFSIRRRWQFWWEIISLLLFSSVVVVILVNLSISRRLSWSIYPLIICGGLWILTTLIAFYNRYPLMLLLGGCIDILLLLLGIDGTNGEIEWLLPLGFPITLGVFVIGGILVAVFRVVARRGLNIVAFVLLAGAVYCVGLEMTLDLYVSQKIALSWSSFVLVSVAPVVAILLLLHIWLRRYMSFRKSLRRSDQ